MEMNHEIKPLLFWEGFPACGLLLRKVVETYPNIIIVSTPSEVPFANLEEELGANIHWLDKPNDIWEQKELFSDRNFVIHTGWNHKGWLKYGSYVKKINNAKVVVVVDNRFKANFRQLIGAIYFRLFLKKKFDAAFVPGREGKKLLKFLGANKNAIYTGNYGAYENIYFETKPIGDRNDEFLFVGQLINRKGVDVMLNAFKQYKDAGGTWGLRILGDGQLKDECVGEGIICEGFSQPTEVSKKMNNAKVLVLVSRDEHWGTVVCEAAACGMSLITTSNVGASADIVLDSLNGIELSKLSVDNLKKAFFYYEKIDKKLLDNASEVSKGIAKGYDSTAYLTSFNKMALDLFES